LQLAPSAVLAVKPDVTEQAETRDGLIYRS
jgi:hypothetical protein